MTTHAASFPRVINLTARESGLWAPLGVKTHTTLATAAAAQEAAYKQGFQAGFQAKSEELAATLDVLAGAKTDLERQAGALEALYRKRCAATLAQIIAAAAPAICEAAAREAITEVFSHAGGDAPRLSLSLLASSDIHAAISLQAPVDLIIDDSLAPGTLIARWNEGGFDCDVGKSLFAIVDLLNAQASPETEENLK